MDHRLLYKASGANNSSKQVVAQAVAANRRKENRQSKFAQHRHIPVDESEPTPTITISNINASSSADANLTKSQRYYLKYLAWRREKQQANTQKSIKRPFNSAVPKNVFLSPQIPNIPRTHVFRPPPNLPRLVLNVFDDNHQRTGTINPVIVTRSMSAKMSQEAVVVGSQKKPSVSKNATPKPKPEAPKNFVQPIVAAPKMERKILKPVSKKIVQPTTKLPPPRTLPKVAPISVPPPQKATAPKINRPTKSIASTKSVTKPPSQQNVMKITNKPANKNFLAVPVNANSTATNASSFVLDGSMITSTAQKTKSNKKIVNKTIDLFSPIEIPQTVKAKSSHESPPVDLNVTPIMPAESPTAKSLNYVSPFVSTKRGKVSARKERKQRDSVYNLNQSACFDPVIDVETRQRREAALYFRKQVDEETNRLMTLADKWQAYKEANGVFMLSEYLDLIDVTTGQTRLLLAKKFGQFRALIEQCESGAGEQKVLAPDLEGFWSMVYMQVEQCNARFERLDKLKATEWREECEIQKPIEVKVARKPKKKQVPAGSSCVLDLLKESRAKFRKEMQEKKAAAERMLQGTPRKTPRKSLLNSVLLQEAVKVASPRQSVAAATPPPSASRIPRRQTTNLGSPSPSIFKKSILKTPATKRRPGRGVVFVDLVANTTSTQRKSQSPLKFICTPMPVVDRTFNANEPETDENTTPNSHGLRNQDRKPRSSDYFSTLETPTNVMKRLSLHDSPRRSMSKATPGKRCVK